MSPTTPQGEPATGGHPLTGRADADLYLRGAQTRLASWEAYARGSDGAEVIRSPGVAVAVFPSEPERTFYNNALLERDLSALERASALDRMEAAYASAALGRFAAWVHESDEAMRDDLEAREYKLDQSTRAMGMALSDIRLAPPTIELAPPDWSEYLRILGVPPDFSAPSIRAPSTCCSPASKVRASRPQWRSIAMATAASTTSPLWNARGGAG